MSLKKGARVKGTTTKGRKVTGTITAVTTHSNGVFVSVKTADGEELKLRPSMLKVIA